MTRAAMTWGLFLCIGCGSPMMMTVMDSGTPMDSGVPMNTMVTASGMLTGTISAAAPTVGYDSGGDVGSFTLRQQGMGPFKVDINVGFGGRPMATTYSSASTGFTCNVTVRSGTAPNDTWTAIVNQPMQTNSGSCSLTLSSATLGSSGYVVAGSLSITANSAQGAASGTVQLSGTF
jgi:hypothetical protein